MNNQHLALLLPVILLAGCHLGDVQLLTIPGNPLKDVNTPLDIDDASTPTEHQDGNKLVLGFEAVPRRLTDATATEATQDYYTDGRSVYATKVPGTSTSFPRYYAFRVISGRLQVDYLGNHFDEAAELKLLDDDGTKEVDVVSMSASHHLSRSTSRDNDAVVVDVKVGNPPKRKLYRLRIGDIERCLNNPCKP